MLQERKWDVSLCSSVKEEASSKKIDDFFA